MLLYSMGYNVQIIFCETDVYHYFPIHFNQYKTFAVIDRSNIMPNIKNNTEELYTITTSVKQSSEKVSE